MKSTGTPGPEPVFGSTVRPRVRSVLVLSPSPGHCTVPRLHSQETEMISFVSVGSTCSYTSELSDASVICCSKRFPQLSATHKLQLSGSSTHVPVVTSPARSTLRFLFLPGLLRLCKSPRHGILRLEPAPVRNILEARRSASIHGSMGYASEESVSGNRSVGRKRGFIFFPWFSS